MWCSELTGEWLLDKSDLFCRDKNSKVLLKKMLAEQVRRNTLYNFCHRRNKSLKFFVSSTSSESSMSEKVSGILCMFKHETNNWNKQTNYAHILLVCRSNECLPFIHITFTISYFALSSGNLFLYWVSNFIYSPQSAKEYKKGLSTGITRQ